MNKIRFDHISPFAAPLDGTIILGVNDQPIGTFHIGRCEALQFCSYLTGKELFRSDSLAGMIGQIDRLVYSSN